jgi:hypothetical protein
MFRLQNWNAFVGRANEAKFVLVLRRFKQAIFVLSESNFCESGQSEHTQEGAPLHSTLHDFTLRSL